MISQSVLEQNMQFYLQKMEENYNQNANKLNQLQNTLQNAAKKIQNMFRRFRLKTSTKAAIKIQRFVRKVFKRIKQKQEILNKFRRVYFSYKIYYSLKSNIVKIKSQCIQYSEQEKKQIQKNTKKEMKTGVLNNIKFGSSKFVVLLSSLQSEISYIKKYMIYDRKKFTQQWQVYEKKQKDWMWQQIRKKWVKKSVQIWINEQQKQINAQKYVSNFIQQCYIKHFQKYENTLKRLQKDQIQLKNRILGLTKAFYFTLLRQI